MFRYLFLVLGLATSFTLSAAGQSENEIDLEPGTMREITRRVLQNEFKPSKEPRTVELYEEGLRWEWLPVIRNVNFVLVSKSEIETRKIEVYFFKSKAKREKGVVFVDFGFGDPFCYASGSTYSYKATKGPTFIRPISGGWGMGCNHGTGH